MTIIPKQAIPQTALKWRVPQPINISMPSVQSLHLELLFAHGETSISTATGFVCMSPAGPVLVTNWHNVSGINPVTGKHLSDTLTEPNQIAISHNGQSLGSFFRRVERLHNDDGEPRWIEHPKWGRRADMVALKLTSLQGVTLHPYDTQKDADIAVGVAEVVSVVGFPFGLQAGGTAIWATGAVASEPDFDYGDQPVFLIDCRARTGQSGSAVIAHRTGLVRRKNGGTALGAAATRLMGIYCGRVNNESDIGRVWKTSAIEELLASVK